MDEIHTIQNQKKEARKQAKQIIARLSEAERTSAARKACAVLKTVPPWREARCILVYLAFGTELNADPVIKAALKESKSVYVPRISGEELEFRRLRGLSGSLEIGPFGIRQPPASEPLWDSLSVPGPTLILVPALAFDKTGGRLGRGGGYYDRFLSRIRREADAAGEKPPLCFGYGYNGQILEEVPMDAADERVDGSVSDGGVIFV